MTVHASQRRDSVLVAIALISTVAVTLPLVIYDAFDVALLLWLLVPFAFLLGVGALMTPTLRLVAATVLVGGTVVGEVLFLANDSSTSSLGFLSLPLYLVAFVLVVVVIDLARQRIRRNA
jgi:hypothetical protein